MYAASIVGYDARILRRRSWVLFPVKRILFSIFYFVHHVPQKIRSPPDSYITLYTPLYTPYTPSISYAPPMEHFFDTTFVRVMLAQGPRSSFFVCSSQLYIPCAPLCPPYAHMTPL